MAEYYIDPVGGNDANPGTQESPRATPPTSANGDSWWFKRGTTYTISAAMNVGASNMTVGAYGAGANPIIEQSNTTTAHGITLNSVVNCVIEDLDVYHPSSTDGVGIRISAGGGHILRRNDIHGGRFGVFLISGPYSIRIEDNDIHDVGDDGLATLACNGGWIINNRIYDVSNDQSTGDCIQFADSATFGFWVIAGNTLTYDGADKQAIITGVASNPHMFLIYDNTIITTIGGIHCRGNAIVLRNKITCADGADFGLQANNGTAGQKQVFIANRVVCEGAFTGVDGGDGIVGMRVADDAGAAMAHDVSFYNNLVVGNVYRGFFAGANIDVGTVRLRNNLLVHTVGNPSVGFSINAAAGATFQESNTAVFGFTSDASGITLDSPVTTDPLLDAGYFPANASVQTGGVVISDPNWKDVFGFDFDGAAPSIGHIQFPLRQKFNKLTELVTRL